MSPLWTEISLLRILIAPRLPGLPVPSIINPPDMRVPCMLCDLPLVNMGIPILSLGKALIPHVHRDLLFSGFSDIIVLMSKTVKVSP